MRSESVPRWSKSSPSQDHPAGAAGSNQSRSISGGAYSTQDGCPAAARRPDAAAASADASAAPLADMADGMSAAML